MSAGMIMLLYCCLAELRREMSTGVDDVATRLSR